MITAERLTRVVRGHAAPVSEASLVVRPGEAVALTGDPGSGASTFLGLLATILRPTSGSLRVGDVDAVRNPIGARRRLCWPVLPAGATGTVSDFLRLVGDARRAGRPHVSAAIDRVSIDAVAPLNRLTAGQRASLAVATVLVANADVVLVDAPLDQEPAVERLWHGVLRDLRHAGTAVVFTARPATNLPPWCDRAVSLDAGRIVEDRTRRLVPETAWQVIRA